MEMGEIIRVQCVAPSNRGTHFSIRGRPDEFPKVDVRPLSPGAKYLAYTKVLKEYVGQGGYLPNFGGVAMLLYHKCSPGQ
jgi:hypothetical protein